MTPCAPSGGIGAARIYGRIDDLLAKGENLQIHTGINTGLMVAEAARASSLIIDGRRSQLAARMRSLSGLINSHGPITRLQISSFPDGACRRYGKGKAAASFISGGGGIGSARASNSARRSFKSYMGANRNGDLALPWGAIAGKVIMPSGANGKSHRLREF
jgi:hypothetical protein